MAWVILTILLCIVLAGCVITFVAAEYTETKVGAAVFAAIAVIAEVAISVGMSVATLGTGQVGLVYNFAGKLTGTISKPGVVWKAPWSSIKKENVLIQREEFDLGQGNSAVSKDQQPIFAHLVLNYQVDPKHVFDLYEQVGPNWKAKLVDSRVLQDFKEITSTYQTVDITNKREQLRTETRARLQKELSPYSIDVRDLFVQNIGFSKGYTAAIEQKQVQVQEAARAQARVAQVEAEARQKVAQANGQAQAKIALATAEAKSNRLIAKSITPELIALRRVEALSKANTIYVPDSTSLFVQGK